MTDSLYKITFSGELMPDADINAVKDNLARLFKSDRSKIDGLFTGSPVALKRELTDADADKYLVALQNAGAKVYKEQDLSSSLSLVETDDHRTTPVEPTEAATRMTCPKCGHEQGTAVECSACGIVIEKYKARQAQLAAEAAANPAPAPAPAATSSLTATLAAADARGASPYATPRAQVADALPEYGELNYFSINGRIGRVRYLGWSMALSLLAMPVMGVFLGLSALSSMIGGVLMFVAMIAMVVVSVFIGGKRLHDLGWSAWLLLVMIIPVVGSVFALIMLFAPGNTGANRYGAPPPPNSKGVVVLAWTMLLVPIIGILAAIAIPAYQDYITRSQQSQYSQPSDESGESADPAAEAATPDYSDEESEQTEE